MQGSISPTYQTLLLQTPISTPTLVGLGKPEETALAMRVNDLFSFRRAGMPVTVRPVGYHGKEGVWVVAVAFCLAGAWAPRFEGAAYLNPRQEEGHSLLRHLARQERLPFLFFSPRLKVAVGQGAGWSVEHRQEVRTLLAQIGHPRLHGGAAGSEDLDFARARKEFQGLSPVSTLLTVHTRSDVHVSSSFRGAVLD